MSLFIQTEVLLGTDIREAAADAITLAKRIRFPVQFEFNDVDVLVHENDTVEDVIKFFERGLKVQRNIQEARAKEKEAKPKKSKTGMAVESQKLYWETVKTTLVEIFSFPADLADEQVKDYLKETKILDVENAVYHEEPYEIACNIAFREANYEDEYKRYWEIRERILGKPND